MERRILGSEDPDTLGSMNNLASVLRAQSQFDEARKLGAEFLATGHHARIIRDDGGGAPRLAMGRDPSKDQSYFLHKLTREQLESTLMPVGEFMKD